MTARTAAHLGAYVLPGPAMDPLQIVPQTLAAEALGLGSIWLSELQGPFKDAGALCGFMGQMTTSIGFGTSISHFGTRHPMVLASWGATMQLMSGNRFLFGFGRSVPQRWERWGIAPQTTELMRDMADILRRLWRGETVSYTGPAGEFPHLSLEEFPDFVPPPLMLAAVGPKTLELGGARFDAVFLHPFLSPEGVATSVAHVRAGAERAGKDPASVTVYHELVTAPDMTDEQSDMVLRARAAAYFSTAGGYGDTILELNGWAVSDLDPFRAAVRTAIEENEAAGGPLKGRQVLVEPSRLMPDYFFDEAAASGTAAQCARSIHDFFDAGADQIIIHGVTPDAMTSTVAAFETQET